jgi:hypothetical protein
MMNEISRSWFTLDRDPPGGPMFRSLLCLVLLAAPLVPADLSGQEVGKGLKEALVQGVGSAVGKLSATDGFLGDPRVRIPLPPPLEKAGAMLRRVGLGEYADQLETTLNRAAESAVAEAKPILLDSLKKMTLADAKGILAGPADGATQYFRRTSGDAIQKKFLPKVKAATAKVKLAEDYDKFATPAAQLGLIGREDADLDGYVARKATDGLFLMVADEEKAIRADPLGQASSLLRKVFGSR